MTPAHDWFDNNENTLIDEPIEPSAANEPMLPIERTEPTLPIERTEPDDPIERNESLLATDHCSRGILIDSAYAAIWPDHWARSDPHGSDHRGTPKGMGGSPVIGGP